MYDHILDALRRGDTGAGLTAAQEAVASQPEDAQAYRLLAVAQQQAGDKPQALASIERALVLAPEDAELHLLRAGLLLGQRQLDEAQAALARSTGLDPNQFPAYILQAQLALGRDDLDETERLLRTAARIAPAHPQLQAIEGTLALRRGDPDRALSILARAAEQAPQEPQLRLALAFAYLAKGHLGFAEQAFRGLLEQDPGSQSLRTLIAGLLLRQGRPAEAADEIAPLLEQPDASPALERLAGELELVSGRPDRALPRLRAAFAALPHDRRILAALMDTWRGLDDAEDARRSLDAALATHPDLPHLWQARLALEAPGSAESRALAERWLRHAPESLPALEAMAGVHEHSGERDQAEVLARRMVEIEPGRTPAQLRLIDRLLDRDPMAAVQHVESLVAQAPNAQARHAMLGWLGYVQDRAGLTHEAVATWCAASAALAPDRLPLTEPSEPRSDWPAMGEVPDPESPPVAFLWGAPGSGVELVAAVIANTGLPLLSDRFGASPPDDPLQNYRTTGDLAAGEMAAEALVGRWRARVNERGGVDGAAIDWVPWWDNALLLALRPHLPAGRVLIALRDPRDMLLDWLAYGAPAPFAIQSLGQAAAWLAKVLDQIAELHEQDLYPHKLLRVDQAHADIETFAAEIGGGLGLDTIMVPPAEVLGPKHFAPGHWRAYAQALAEPFALLTPVARRLGYPED